MTEDSKAAPTYFEEARVDSGLPPARVVVQPSRGSDPLTVVQHLMEIWDDEARGLPAGEIPFERAFAVVDRDSHDLFRFTQAREQLRQKDDNVRGPLRLAADAAADAAELDEDREAAAASQARAAREVLCFALSEPCFEYWLLLHFGYTRAPFAATGTKSPCDAAVSDLKTAGLTDYAKGARGLWTRTKPLYDTAKRHAERGRVDAASTGAPNPTTEIDHVVDAIRDLAQT